MKTIDHHTRSNISSIKINHVDLSLQVDFEKEALIGTATLHVTVLNGETEKIVLDSNELKVHDTSINGINMNFCMNEASRNTFGLPIEVSIPKEMREAGKKFELCIKYETTPESTAIQWLSKQQTADKQYPYLFTQCQAIHARSLLPCQDCPSSKITYKANITVPSWAQCLMSAVAVTEENTVASTTKTFVWEQKVPIPSYLVAMVVGHLESRDIGPRSRVWCEPSMVDAVAFEFAQTEEFIQHAESIMAQEYVWGRYDLVCLPPSFPYGGMENPCLTFVTPTLLAGDRSLADVVAHEIAHSWTGNLITNHTWEHFWLNEGWTVWLQRKIMSRVYPDMKGFFDFDSTIGWKHLSESVHHFGEDHPFTVMVPKLENVDPDDSFSSVPYEKGFNFLYYLSRMVGEQEFESFAQAYVQEFKFKTLTTDDFVRFFKEFFSKKVEILEAIDWEKWLYSPGMPYITPTFDTSISSASFNLGKTWLESKGEGCTSKDIEGWTSSQIVVMLEYIITQLEEDKDKSMSLDTLTKMDSLYSLSETKNTEVRFRWQTLCIRMEAPFIFPYVEKFLKEQGRMKFVRPLYRELNKISSGKEMAVRIFEEWKMQYHPIAQKMIAKDLK